MNKNLIFGLGILVLLALGVFLYKFWLITFNLVGGFLLYLLIDKFMEKLERYNITGFLAYAILFLGFGILAVCFVLFVSIPLIHQGQDFVAQLPDKLAEIKTHVDEIEQHIPFVSGLYERMRESLLTAVKGIVSVSGSLLTSLITIFIMAATLLASRNTLRQTILDHLPNDYFEVAVSVAHKIIEHIQNYTVAKTAETIIVTLLHVIGFWMIGLPLPLLLGIVAGLLNIIPYVGPILTLPPVLVAAFLAGGYQLAGLATLVIILTQLIDNTVLQTWLLSQFVDIHPFMAVLITLVAGELLGPIGMVIAVPVYVISKLVLSGLYEYLKSMQRHEEFLRQEKSEQEYQTREHQHQLNAHIL